MREKAEKARVRLELTRRQKEQIRRATGWEVNSLELRLHALPEVSLALRRGREPGRGRTQGNRKDRTDGEGERSADHLLE